MTSSSLPASLLSLLSQCVAAQLGLHFPPERWPDLERGLRAAAPELGFEEAETCAQWLVTPPVSPRAWETLASYLTIGETYFFREKSTLDIFEAQILPALIGARRRTGRQIRLWSAGCCTGEEPYTLAMLVSQALPDVSDWNITILATDINPRFLQKAREGVYSEWSFRNTPSWVKEKYFQKTEEGRFEILPRIKKMVTFAPLNLADAAYPSVSNGTNAVDVIFCRNVLIYFAPEPMKKIVHKFYRSLAEGGWLIVSPAETSAPLFSEFATASYAGATLYCKEGHSVPPALAPPQPQAAARKPPERPNLPERPKPPAQAARAPDTAEVSALRARACANAGDLNQALEWCREAIVLNKLNPGLYYLQATILQEEGSPEKAAASLKRALYLNHDFVLAHFALGNLAWQQGKKKEADRHWANALLLLQSHQPEDILPESEGMTAGGLSDIITSLRKGGAAP